MVAIYGACARNTPSTTKEAPGGRRARVRGLVKVAADFALLAAAVNLARLGVPGVACRNGAWTAGGG
jgi:IS5 family transposase